MTSYALEKWKLSAALLAVIALGGVARADEMDSEGAYLDAPYKNLVQPIDDTGPEFINLFDLQPALTDRSNTAALIGMQTPVRSQGARGTCAIFSATAMLESMRVITGQATTSQDLSEEWLEYLNARTKTTDGSSAPGNYSFLARYGFVSESAMPYIGEDWTQAPGLLSEQRCGSVPAAFNTGCLLAHRDPRLLSASDVELSNPSSPLYDVEFLNARREGQMNRSKFMAQTSNKYWISNVSDVKRLLAAGLPVALESDFYYGAWNHRKANDLGIGRDMNSWYRGVVGYPEPGSKDRIISTEGENRAGHSIQLVGYDDNVVVTTNVLMNDGTTKTFTYKGVYYFKNSWGTAGFGSQFTLDGKAYPGYGMITYKYAHEQGAFYRLPLDDLK